MTPEELDQQTKVNREMETLEIQRKQALEFENTPLFRKLFHKLQSFFVFTVLGTFNFAFPAALFVSILLDSLYDILGLEWAQENNYSNFEVMLNTFGYMFQTSLVWYEVFEFWFIVELAM